MLHRRQRPRISIKDLHKAILSQQLQIPSRKREFDRLYLKSEVERTSPIQITKNDIILGHANGNFSRSNIKKLDINLFSQSSVESVVMGFLGITGGGKTVTAYNVFLDNLVYRLGMCFFGYDPKGEAWIHKEAMESLLTAENREKVDELLREEGMKRQGYDLLIVAPAFIGKQKNVDRYFAVSYQDLMDIFKHDPDEAVKLFLELLGIPLNDSETIDTVTLIMQKGNADSFENFKRQCEKETKKMLGGGVHVYNTLFRKLRLRMGTILSDDPDLHLDLLAEMKKRQGKGGIVFKGKLKTGEGHYVDQAYSAILKLCLSKIFYDGLLWNVAKDKKAVLQSDVGVLLDELDTIAPDSEKNTTSLFIRNYATKGRQAGINLGLVVQEASTVDHELFEQTRIIFSSRLSESNGKVLAKRGIPQETIKYLQGLKMKVKTNMGWDAGERFVIDSNNNLTIYIYGIPLSQFMFKGLTEPN